MGWLAGFTITRVLIEFDINNVPWHIGTGTTQPIGTLDLRSTSTHELGHAMGFYHVSIAGCGQRHTAQTMCPAHIVAQQGSQQTFYRDIEQHEKADYESKYQ